MSILRRAVCVCVCVSLNTHHFALSRPEDAGICSAWPKLAHERTTTGRPLRLGGAQAMGSGDLGLTVLRRQWCRVALTSTGSSAHTARAKSSPHGVCACARIPSTLNSNPLYCLRREASAAGDCCEGHAVLLIVLLVNASLQHGASP